jgi:hypothetical protein
VVIGIVVVTPAEFVAFLVFAVWTVIVSVLTWRRSAVAAPADEPADGPVLVR